MTMLTNPPDSMRDLINSSPSMQGLFGGPPERMDGLLSKTTAQLKPLLPKFQTTATSIAWLLTQAKEIQKKTMAWATGSSIAGASPQTILKEMQKDIDGKNDKALGNRTGPPRIGQINPTMYVGDLISYVYDPKHKKTLPYYDTFPLVFPIEMLADGFLGINLHYLPPEYRFVLLTALYTLRNNTNMDHTTRLNISYQILKRASRFQSFKPCLKRYLTAHIRSARMTIHPSQWAMVVALPTARFMKANESKVWSDSINIINGIKP